MSCLGGGAGPPWFEGSGGGYCRLGSVSKGAVGCFVTRQIVLGRSAGCKRG